MRSRKWQTSVFTLTIFSSFVDLYNPLPTWSLWQGKATLPGFWDIWSTVPHICPHFSHPSSIFFFLLLLPPLIGGPSQSSSAISLFGSVFQYLLGKTRGINMSDKTNIQEPPQCVLGLTVRFSFRERGSKKKQQPQSGGNLARYLKRSDKSISTTQTALWRIMDL